MQEGRPRDQSGLHPGLAQPLHSTGAIKARAVSAVVVASKIRHLTDVSA